MKNNDQGLLGILALIILGIVVLSIFFGSQFIQILDTMTIIGIIIIVIFILAIVYRRFR